MKKLPTPPSVRRQLPLTLLLTATIDVLCAVRWSRGHEAWTVALALLITLLALTLTLTLAAWRFFPRPRPLAPSQPTPTPADSTQTAPSPLPVSVPRAHPDRPQLDEHIP